MRLNLVLSLVFSVLLTACGGGGGGNNSGGDGNTPAPANPKVMLYGMAAEGNPLVNTAVEIRGSNGESTSTTTDLSGQFEADIFGLAYPIMLKAVGSNAYYSALHTNSSSYINITPLTTLSLAAMLGTHPENVFNSFGPSTLKDDNQLYSSMVQVVQKFNTLPNISNMNFFSFAFQAQAGNIYDDLLEALKADLIANGKTLTQVMNELIVANNPDPSCPSGQHKDEANNCVPSVRSCDINNGVGEQAYVTNYWTACQVISCNTNYTQSGSLCLPSTRSCETLPSNAVSGTETWGGTSWNACQISECAENFELDQNACVAEESEPVVTGLSISETGMSQAYLDLRLVNLGTKSLFLTHENDTQNAYIVDSTSVIKAFIDPNPAVYGHYESGALIGNDLYYQLSKEQVAGKFSLYKVNTTTGGTSQAIHLDNSVAGYNSPSRAAVHSMGTSIYYRAQQGSSALNNTGIYKYDTVTQSSTKVIADLSTYLLTLKEKVSSGNLVMFYPATDLTPQRYILSALDANDQVLTLQELLMSDYECLSGQLSPFNDCSPVYLEGRAMIQFRKKSDDSHRMLITDGTISGTSFIDIPYHYGGMANVTIFQNKLIFTAISKANIYGGTQLYGYSFASGFHLIKTISDPSAPTNVIAITADNTGAYVITKTTSLITRPAPVYFEMVTSGQILKTQGTEATTSVLVNSASTELLALMSANIYNRGPFVALKGHLVFTSSNQSNDINSPVALKALKLSDQSITTLRTDFTGHITYYKKDLHSEKIIVSEKVTNVNNSPAKILIVQ